MKYERLTYKSGNAICIKETSTNDNKSIWNAIERLAELEDDLESGKMIRLPCKVNDTVYVIDEMENSCGEIVCREVESCIVKEISIFDGFVCFGLVDTYGIIRLPIEEIYTTKAEAEKKLKELKGEV